MTRGEPKKSIYGLSAIRILNNGWGGGPSNFSASALRIAATIPLVDWASAPDKNITSRHVSRIHSAQFKVGVVFTLHLQLASVFLPPRGNVTDYCIGSVRIGCNFAPRLTICAERRCRIDKIVPQFGGHWIAPRPSNNPSDHRMLTNETRLLSFVNCALEHTIFSLTISLYRTFFTVPSGSRIARQH